MNSVLKVNTPIIEHHHSSLISEINHFNNSYNTFKSSYLNNSSDNVVRMMANKIDYSYKQIDASYNNLNKWLTAYLENIKGLEEYISESGSLGAITESAIRSISMSKLKRLPDYNIKFSGAFKRNLELKITNTISVTKDIFAQFIAMNTSKIFNKLNSQSLSEGYYYNYTPYDLLLTKEDANKLATNLLDKFTTLKQQGESLTSGVIKIKGTIKEAAEISTELDKSFDDLLRSYDSMIEADPNIIYMFDELYTDDFAKFMKTPELEQKYATFLREQWIEGKKKIVNNEEISVQNFASFTNIMLAGNERYVSKDLHDFLFNYYTENYTELVLLNNGLDGDWGPYSKLKKVHLYNSTDEICEKICKQFPEYFNTVDLSNVKKDVYFYTNKEFEQLTDTSTKYDSTIVGFTDTDGNTHQNITGSIGVIEHTITHELIHKYAYNDESFLSIGTGLVKGKGIELDQNSFGVFSNQGFNEATTEYIAKIIDSEATGIDSMTTYDRATEFIQESIDIGIIKQKTLLDAYFNGNIKDLENELNTNLNGISNFKEVSTLIDKVIYSSNSQDRINAENALNKIIVDYNLKSN